MGQRWCAVERIDDLGTLGLLQGGRALAAPKRLDRLTTVLLDDPLDAADRVAFAVEQVADAP